MFDPEEIWDDNHFPLAYLITFRTFGTWLHGDERASVDTHKNKNIYGAPKITANENLQNLMKANMSQSPVLLNKEQQSSVEEAIKQVCLNKNFRLYAINVRSNHVHTVVSAQLFPEPSLSFLRSMRQECLESWI